MNRDFTGTPSPEDPPSRQGVPEPHWALDERRVEEPSCRLAGSLEEHGVGLLPPPHWMQAHLTECLSCLNDFTRLQSLTGHSDPIRRRWLLEHKKFWLLPIVGLLVLFGGLIVLTQGSAIAPFIYALW